MTLQPSSLVDSIRQSEYTGANRCLPCTAVNIVLAAIVAVAAAQVSLVIGGFCLAVCLVVIYVRGYLVPGTPRLTEHFFPEAVLRFFEKRSTETNSTDNGSTPERLNTTENRPDIDPTPILESAEVIELHHDRGDLTLSPEFRTKWQSRIDELSETPEAQRRALAEVTGTNEEEITFVDTEEGVIADVDGTWIGTWPSRAALVAAVAATPLLKEGVDTWHDFCHETRESVLRELRTFLGACPTCSEPVAKNVERRTISCCRTTTHVRYRCEGCGAILVERVTS